MEHTIYKDSRGASQADVHYLEWGHKIVCESEWNTRSLWIMISREHFCIGNW